eukprot:Platyproteum_vivax@DN9228_c0_g1_i1.p1
MEGILHLFYRTICLVELCSKKFRIDWGKLMGCGISLNIVIFFLFIGPKSENEILPSSVFQQLNTLPKFTIANSGSEPPDHSGCFTKTGPLNDQAGFCLKRYD